MENKNLNGLKLNSKIPRLLYLKDTVFYKMWYNWRWTTQIAQWKIFWEKLLFYSKQKTLIADNYSMIIQYRVEKKIFSCTH